MQKSDSNSAAKIVRHKVQSSTTLDRRYVKRPSRNTDVMVSVKKSPSIKHFRNMNVSVKEKAAEQPIAPAVVHPVQNAANVKMKSRMASVVAPAKMTAKELKDQAIKKALANAAKPLDKEEDVKLKKNGKKRGNNKIHFGLGRIVLALSCAAAAVFAIVYFVNLNMPDISMRVAAMRTGIDATYPSYVPRDFSLSDITSEEGKVVLNFRNANTGDAFSLIEENSSWDSNALLTNYIKKEYGENYTTVREQGLTIYMSDNKAAWVNGGIVFKINITSGSLTKKQIQSIAVSL